MQMNSLVLSWLLNSMLCAGTIVADYERLAVVRIPATCTTLDLYSAIATTQLWSSSRVESNGRVIDRSCAASRH